MRRALALLPLLLLGAVIGVITDDSGGPRVYSWSGTGAAEIPAFDFPGGPARLCFGLDLPEERVGGISVEIVEEATGRVRLDGTSIGRSMVQASRPICGVILAGTGQWDAVLPPGRYSGSVESSSPFPWSVRIETP